MKKDSEDELQDKAARRRRGIVTAAAEVMQEKGVAGTTTRNIAARADVNLAMLHYDFASKQDILVAVLDYIVEEVGTVLLEALTDVASIEQAVIQVTRTYWDYVERTPALQRVQYELTVYALSDAESAQLARRQYAGYLDAVSTILASVAETTGQEPVEPVDHVAAFLLAGMDGLILQLLAHGDARRCRAALDLLQRSAIGLISGKSTTDERED